MPQQLNRVQPGDLITANMWNSAIDAINQLLLSRPVATLNVTALSPAGTTAEPIRINALLQIVGRNFGYSTGQSKVSFEGPFGSVDVTFDRFLQGSSDTRLMFRVPDIPTMTTSGMTLTLRTDSGAGQDLRSVFVKPIVIAMTGDMFVTLRTDVSTPKPNPLKTSVAGGPAQPAEFGLQLQSSISLPATFSVSANIKNASVAVPAGLVSSIVILDQNGNDITNKTIDMAKDDKKFILVRIPDLPASFANQKFTLEVVATAGTVTGTFSREFTVGTAVQPPDPNIQPRLTGGWVQDANDNITTNPANGTRVGTTLKVKKSFEVVVAYEATLTGNAATYDVTIETKGNAAIAGWAGAIIDTGVRVSDTKATIQGPGTPTVQFGVTPNGATPAAKGTFVLRIQRQGAPDDWFQEFDVELL